MKTLLRYLPLLALGFLALRAAESAAPSDPVAALTAADDERLAAMTAADPARLDAIFSDDLRYAHSNGHIDSKASLTESLVSHKTVYEKVDYATRDFRPAGPGVVLMTGRAMFHVTSGGNHLTLDLGFLAVWREENGHWRFLAWQSCRMPEPAK
ncbi:MAG TPA: nuclear transport factor 2 family protein [Opitutus sp.]|nr:nuclear transport factor 2 family protein [Opitutus sp.]